MAAAGPLAVTFIARSICALTRVRHENAGDAGVKRILTSGQQSSAEKGISLITELIAAGDTQSLWPVRESAPRTCRCFCRRG